MDIINIFDDYLDMQFQFPLRRYNLRRRPNYMVELSNNEFFKRFRLKKETFTNLLNLIEIHIRHRSQRNSAISPLNQLLITLRYYASGSFYIVAGDFGGVHKSTVGKIVQRVSHAIANLCPYFIQMPSTNRALNIAHRSFYDIARFPRVIGAVDGTLVKIQSPGGDNAEDFRSRKGYFAINVQGMCDANYKFTNIVARWSGSTHDSTVFNNSTVRFQFERGDYGNSIILGDAGYPVRTYLLTPLANPRTPAEVLYNEAQIRTRNVIERTFGIWKRRFPIIGIGMRCHVPLAQQIIVATAVIHNIARDEAELPVVPDIEEQYPDQPDIQEIPIQDNGNANDRIRRELVDYFNNL